MLLWLAIAAALLLAPVAGVFPPQRTGRAFNAILHIAMPAAPTYGTHWRAVQAQEVVEWWAAWLGAVVLTAPLAWALATFLPFGWILAPLPLPLAWKWRTTRRGERLLEYLGWAATWVHGRRSAPEYYTDLAAHARAMRGGYRVFDRTNEATALRNLRRAIPLARVLVALLARRIRKGHP